MRWRRMCSSASLMAARCRNAYPMNRRNHRSSGNRRRRHASQPAQSASPLVAVTNTDGTLAGVVTMHALLDRILGDGA